MRWLLLPPAFLLASTGIIWMLFWVIPFVLGLRVLRRPAREIYALARAQCD